MRDKIMDEQYFCEYIQQQERRIDRFVTSLENNTVKPDRIASVKSRIDSLKYSILVAEYSYGEDIDKLEPLFIEQLKDMPLYWNENSSYVDMVWMMSLAILFDVDKELFCILSDLACKCKRNDALIDFFIKYKLEDKIEAITGEYSYGYPYVKLSDVVADRENSVKKLKEYLEKHWYKGHGKMPFYNIHKHKDKLYCGYWSFEAGAIAKILKLDDSSLRDVKYYPYDLVHYKK